MKSRNTKNLITQAAFTLFAEQGFDSSSIRTIAKEVGIRESAIYNHFPSKTAILEEIFKTKINHNLSAELLTDDILGKIEKPKLFLTKFVGKLLETWEQHDEQLLFSLLIKESTSQRKNSYSLFNYIEEFINLWTFIFEQMINFGAIKKANPDILANEFVSPLFFFRMAYFSSESSFERKKVKKKISAHIDYFANTISK